MKRIILAITGASGSLYALEFLSLLAELEVEVHLVLSEAGEQVLQLETGQTAEQLAPLAVRRYDIKDFTAPFASGSAVFSGMAVLPCSMGTLAAVAGGLSHNLIHRAADVTLKERRPLVLAVRETPLNRTHMHNMLKVHDAGAIICPAMPGFYHGPQNLAQLARAFAGRVAEQLGLVVPDLPRWQG
ncbi:UbiX family flavin prenyltransferase [Desulfurivibrio alkaliphilus]|uniref:Flavin prenyltransferase UbiX n=1 Tax=Desulfurivibrio alkaliphilus (strain DSM 19089 / UNIQEM U267 / AHT2) TaxID=589865 RepID=D6Z0P8_DESAT|nr:UbiX family flavin prenyltransferase [Desulfurivibrio alkaliphilus]ADH85277.1 3-octaprenyl-4-hydroxybenzoate carboxy-lyase [Desulfurivibrio alkaliphilus AHT 2]